MELVVPQVPMPVEQNRAIPVALENTINKLVKQLLQVVKNVAPGCIMINQRHSVAKYVWSADTMTKQNKRLHLVAKNVALASTTIKILV